MDWPGGGACRRLVSPSARKDTFDKVRSGALGFCHASVGVSVFQRGSVLQVFQSADMSENPSVNQISHHFKKKSVLAKYEKIICTPVYPRNSQDNQDKIALLTKIKIWRNKIDQFSLGRL